MMVIKVLGSVVYRIIIALALRYNLMSANSLKLLSALIVAATRASRGAGARHSGARIIGADGADLILGDAVFPRLAPR